MTIRIGETYVTKNHFCHVHYSGMYDDSGYYVPPFVSHSNFNVVRTALGAPNRQRIYIRKVTIKTTWSNKNMGFSEWVCAFEIPFENHFEEKAALDGQCYMSLMPILNFDYHDIEYPENSNGQGGKIVKKNITMQPSFIGMVLKDILQHYFGVKTINYYAIVSKGGYMRQSIDI